MAFISKTGFPKLSIVSAQSPFDAKPVAEKKEEGSKFQNVLASAKRVTKKGKGRDQKAIARDLSKAFEPTDREILGVHADAVLNASAKVENHILDKFSKGK